jgi:hypothetical protein
MKEKFPSMDFYMNMTFSDAVEFLKTAMNDKCFGDAWNYLMSKRPDLMKQIQETNWDFTS